MSVCVVVLIAVLTLAFMPAGANAAAPVLEFVSPGHHFPIGFEADGGEVTAVLTGFDTVVQCTGSHGEGEITGPRSTLSNYVFTGCETQGGSFSGHKCKSLGANEGEITTGTIEADLVYIDQANHEVGILLNPSGGAYMNFECGSESVEASGPFLSPVGPINQGATTFTATLTRSGATQTPNEYENENGEKLPAIPMGKRGANPFAPTGVELSFTVTPEVPLEIKAITGADLEAKRQEEEAATAAAVKKRQEAEAATAAAVKKRLEEEAATAAAVKKRQEEEAAAKAKSKQLTRGQLLARALKQCKKSKSKHKRMQCEKLAKKKYGGQEKPKTHKK
jgi:hypothetical protein